MSETIAQRDYFSWKPVLGHAEECKQTRWEMRQRRTEHVTGRQEIEVQAVCPQVGGCGVVLTWSFSLAPDKDAGSGNTRSGYTFSSRPVEHIGYGTKPVRVGEVWLHAGSPMLPKYEGPEYYLVTRSPAPPRDWPEVLGYIAPARRSGRQVKSRWHAAAGLVPNSSSASATVAVDDLKSRAAAISWVCERAAELSDAAVVDPAPVDTLTPQETYL